MTHTDKWASIQEDAVATLSRYIQFHTSNPPGNEMEAAQWVAEQLKARKIMRSVDTRIGDLPPQTCSLAYLQTIVNR